jgi:hypothetical protein
MLQAHLAWAEKRFGDVKSALRTFLEADSYALVERATLATGWVPFQRIIEIDKAIARAAGGQTDATFAALGRFSARLNLEGAYASFVSSEPHKFFENMSRLHPRFQDFGTSRYVKRGERSGQIWLEGLTSYSPVFCLSGIAYYQEALLLMKVPGPIRVTESSCTCQGEKACVFDMVW